MLSDSSIVSLLTLGGSIAASGILVSERQVLTGAYVSSEALGVPREPHAKTKRCAILNHSKSLIVVTHSVELPDGGASSSCFRGQR